MSNSHRTLLPSLSDMRSDLREYLPEMTRREKVGTWLRFYFKPTRSWVDRLVMWNDRRRYGPLPREVKDRIAHHFGFVDGVPPCTDGPVCAAHGWRTMPIGGEGEGEHA